MLSTKVLVPCGLRLNSSLVQPCTVSCLEDRQCTYAWTSSGSEAGLKGSSVLARNGLKTLPTFQPECTDLLYSESAWLSQKLQYAHLLYMCDCLAGWTITATYITYSCAYWTKYNITYTIIHTYYNIYSTYSIIHVSSKCHWIKAEDCNTPFLQICGVWCWVMEWWLTTISLVGTQDPGCSLECQTPGWSSCRWSATWYDWQCCKNEEGVCVWTYTWMYGHEFPESYVPYISHAMNNLTGKPHTL